MQGAWGHWAPENEKSTLIMIPFAGAGIGSGKLSMLLKSIHTVKVSTSFTLFKAHFLVAKILKNVP
jgi:hypothetical protein